MLKVCLTEVEAHTDQQVVTPIVMGAGSCRTRNDALEFIVDGADVAVLHETIHAFTERMRDTADGLPLERAVTVGEIRRADGESRRRITRDVLPLVPDITRAAADVGTDRVIIAEIVEQIAHRA